MRNAFRIFRRDLKRILRNPAALLVIIGVSIIPSLYAWFNIVANIDPYANTSGINLNFLLCAESLKECSLFPQSRNRKATADLKADC